MSKKASCRIRPDVELAPPIHSKYRVELLYRVSPDAIGTLVLNINADVALKQFSSEGAAEKKYKLLATYNDLADDLTGFGRFRGHIGAGKIEIVLESGVTISGPITGGPKESQTFVGTGTWTAS